MTTEISKLVLMIIAILGLAQAGFLMLLLRDEGKRAFRANRWLMVFAFASCLSFIEDITDVFLTPKWMLIVAPVFMAMTFAFVCLRAVHLSVLPRNCRPTGIKTNLPFPGSASGSGGNVRNGVDSV